MYSELDTRANLYERAPFPSFERPHIVGYLSLNSKRKLVRDISQLKFVRNISEKPVSFDLNHLIDEVVRRYADCEDERLSHLLQYLTEEMKVEPSKTLDGSNFICYRGLLTLIATTPYENKDSWRIVASLYKGRIYLCALDTEEKQAKRRNMSAKDLQFMSWGYKFEQYVTSDSPFSNPNLQEPVNENEEFSLVFRNKLNKHKILYAAEMDGIRCDRPSNVTPPPSKDASPQVILDYLKDKVFVELKTSRRIEFSHQERTFRRFKSKSWWCQSFLAGVEDILCGVRNDDGIVEYLQLFNVNKLAKENNNFWKPNVCFNFLDNFLTYVKRCFALKLSKEQKKIDNLDELTTVETLHFEWSPRQRVRVTDNYNEEIDKILPDYFIRAI